MKNLKKVFLATVFLAIAVSVSAQFHLGVKAGLNASMVTNADQWYPDNAKIKFKPGFHVGAAAQYLFTESIGIESGLYFSMLGTKATYKGTIEEWEGTVDFKDSYGPFYLQLPVSFLYRFEMGPDLFLCPNAGVYLGFGLGGKSKSKLSSSGFSAEYSEDYFDSYTNKVDLGAKIGLDVEYGKFSIGLGYDLGILKINKESATGYKDNRNGNIRVSVGYFFF
jgi:hypothetical protein